MKAIKALRLFNALTDRKTIGRDREKDTPIESRYQFAVRLTAGTKDEGKTREWSVRVTALHDGADWREVFEAVREADSITYGDGEVWPRTNLRVENAGIELS